MTDVMVRNGYYRPLASADLPTLREIDGVLPISKIAPDGLTGQTIIDGGSNALFWRYPHHIAGPSAYHIVPYAISPMDTAVRPSANVVKLYRFQVPFTITIASISFYITTASAATTASVGIYDNNGNLMHHTGAISSARTGVKSASVGPAPLLPGSYYWGWTCSSSTPRFLGITEEVELIEMLNNGADHCGEGSTASVAGALPASFGTFSAVSQSIAAGVLQG